MSSSFQKAKSYLLAHWIVLSFFALFFLLGMSIFHDYGMTYDEGTMDSLGRDSYAYVFNHAPWPTNTAWGYHGSLVEFSLYTMQKMFFSFDDALIYRRILFRRFICFLFFFSGSIVLYHIARKHFKNWRYALLATGMIILTPRIFAQGFYNSRDIPELTFFALSMLTLMRLLEHRSWKNAAVHGLATALALSVRMSALMIPAITLLFLFLDVFFEKNSGWKERASRNGYVLLLYLGTLASATVAFWPFLWEHPVGHFLEAYRFMGSLGNGAGDFLGRHYGGFPWPYIPVWMGITIPPVYTILFLSGTAGMVHRFWKSRSNRDTTMRSQLLFLAWFFGPIAAILVTGAGIYTEWRHIYFIYPAFVLIAVEGLRFWIESLSKQSGNISRYGPRMVCGILAIEMVFISGWMIKNHPFENVYFTLLPQPVIEKYFPLDYWALSYRQSIQWLLQHEKRPYILVYSNENQAFLNAYNNFPESQEKIYSSPKDRSQYILTRDQKIAEGLPLIHEFTVDGMRINGIYKGNLFDYNYPGPK